MLTRCRLLSRLTLRLSPLASPTFRLLRFLKLVLSVNYYKNKSFCLYLYLRTSHHIFILTATRQVQ